MRLVFDIETNGLLESLNKIHCIEIKDIDNGTELSFTPENVEVALPILENAEELIGHNVLKFDIPAIQKMYPGFKPKGKIFDTLICSRLIWTDIKDRDFRGVNSFGFPMRLVGRHSLEAWGYRLKIYKGDFHKETDWQNWSEEMQKYCKQDVKITFDLYNKIHSKDYSTTAIELEHKFAKYIWLQEQHGFSFNVDAGQKLYSQLAARRQEIYEELQKVFPPWQKDLGTWTPKRNNKTKGYIAGIAINKYQEITFNPASRDHIADRLIKLKGWAPKEFTNEGKPKVDESVLNKLTYPETKLLSEYLMINKRIGQLAEGNNAWLKLEKEGKIYGSVNTNGTITGRCTHQNPNVSQVPAVNLPYGLECRSLFIADNGCKLVGVDVSGLELRVLSHYLFPYDDGEYIKQILQGDIHKYNQEAAGLDSRDTAKTYIYATLYGAGLNRLSEITGKSLAETKRINQQFLKNIPALKRLKEDVIKTYRTKNYLKGLDGRKLSIRSEHSALNTLIQSAGALIVKQATINLHEQLLKKLTYGKDFAQAAHIHDEFQLQVRKGLEDYVGKEAVKAIEDTQKNFNFRCELTGEYKIGRTWADTH